MPESGKSWHVMEAATVRSACPCEFSSSATEGECTRVAGILQGPLRRLELEASRAAHPLAREHGGIKWRLASTLRSRRGIKGALLDLLWTRRRHRKCGRPGWQVLRQDVPVEFRSEESGIRCGLEYRQEETETMADKTTVK